MAISDCISVLGLADDFEPDPVTADTKNPDDNTRDTSDDEDNLHYQGLDDSELRDYIRD